MKPLDEILLTVEKPARYLGGEYNSVVKNHAAVPMKVVLAFPDTYEIGMSHLGLRILYDLFNKRDDMLMERVFAPWPDLEAALRENAQPLFTLETHSPLRAFDVIGFTLQFELCYTNILMMLDLAGIPSRADQRGEDFPLIVGGGPVAFSPEPIADFFDLFHIGDGEECFPRLLETYAELKKTVTGSPRERRLAILRELTKIPGTYAPQLYATERDPQSGLDYVVPRAGLGWDPPYPVVRAVLDDINKFPFPAKTIVPHSEIVHDRVSVEIARGCTEGCRFCQAGIIYRPVRERTPESILEAALSGLERTGYDEVSVTSLSPADYSCFPTLVEKIMDRVADERVGVSVSSLRPYGLTEHLAGQIGRVKKTGFTIAPEAGSQRMRDVLNKGITEEHILTAARNASRQGWDLIKLYMMIGVIGETEQDLLAIVDLAHHIYDVQRAELKKVAGAKGRLQPRVNLSASSHIPKPFAPFQWMAMETVDALYAKQRFISDRIKRRGIKFKRHHVETSRLEGVMSRGDRRVADVIEIAYRKGCRFDGWTEQFRPDLWEDAFREAGVDPEIYLADLPIDSRLPWDHIDCLVEKKFLVREYQRALKGLLSPACEKPYRRHNLPPRMEDKLICYDCGCACDLDHIKSERVEGYEKLIQLLPLKRPLAPAAPDGPSYAYRSAFSKRGPMKFLSHLDLVRTMSRALRRAGVSLKYSQGFNPRPLLSFSPALAVGIESDEEYLDFHSGAPLPASIVERLNEVLPTGLAFIRVVPLAASSPQLARGITAATYLVRLAGVNAEDLRPRVEAFNEATELFIEKVRKERSVSLDLKRFVGGVELVAGDVEAEQVALLRFPICLDPTEGSVRPEEVLEGILGSLPEGASFLRERLHFASAPGVS
ncbi:MAG TPA: TIGR03960 family B12-binding radical SAM protein [Candidatus Polarisedimenticolia bacterium]|nr:TIGR03960 family B12-binding radical SAM protein [Candidatus Polarisedimenticolia bacterium]